MSQSPRPSAPPEVIAAALLFGAFTLWRLFASVLPSWLAGDPNSGTELVSILLAGWLVVGLFRLQPGARSLARFLAGLLAAASLALLSGGINETVVGQLDAAVAASLNRHLAAGAATGALIFLLLGTRASREAFTQRRR